MIAPQVEPASPPIAALAQLRGRLIANAQIGRQTWFGVGGPAELLYRPADCEDLCAFLAALPSGDPVTVLGGGSNLLIRDGGLPGVTIRLGRGLAGVAINGSEVLAGAGALHLNIALAAAEAGIAGLEFLCGIPGSIGGGLRMNAGAYGREFKDIIKAARVVDRAGTCRTLSHEQIGFHYRHTDVAEDMIFLGATLQGEKGNAAAIQAKMQDIQNSRAAT